MVENRVFHTADRYVAGLFIYHGFDTRKVLLEPNVVRPDGHVSFGFAFPEDEHFSIEHLEQLAQGYYAGKIQVDALTFSHAVKRAFGLVSEAIHQAKYAARGRTP